MNNRQHALRNIALKLNVSGTAEILDEQRLYKGSYGFVKLQVYVPKTQNTEAPIMSAFCTTVDELGREVVSTKNYRLWYVDEYELDGAVYLLFERHLPKEFTEKVTQENGLKITFNYCDSAPIYDTEGNALLYSNGVAKRHATDVLISSRYETTVHPGGWNDDSMELDINNAEAAQIAENMRNIAELQADVYGFLDSVEGYRTAAEEARDAALRAQEAAEEAERIALGAQSAAELAQKGSLAAQGAAEQAKQDALNALKGALAAQQAAEEAALSIENLNITTKQDAAIAQQAREAAELAASIAEEAVQSVQGQFDDILAQLANKADNLFFNNEDGKLYLMAGDEIIGDGVTVATSGGGGGGGSYNNAVLTVQNTTGWLSKTIAENASCLLSGTWSSIEDDLPTGNGVLTIKVGGIVKRTTDIPQGAFSVNVSEYLTAGTNAVKLTVSDVYGNSRTISFSISVVALSLSSTFNASMAYSGSIPFTYVPKGNVSKEVHFLIDGEEETTETVLVSGRQQTYNIPAQAHGSHTLEVYFTANVDGEDIESNHLHYDLICTESGNNTPIIACVFTRDTIAQYETVNISYIVYNPASLNASITLAANGQEVAQLTVGRSEQVWAYRADTPGALTLTITCGETVKTISATVEATSIEVEAETADLELYLTSSGRNNTEANPASWSFGDIVCTFAGYNWSNDGWQRDEQGIPVHRVTGDARLTIPLKVFQNDFRGTGKTIEIEFATRNVLDYDAVIMSCFSNNKGFQLTSQKALLKSEQAEISTQYKEGEHIRLSFVVEKSAENRLIYIYLNGIMCGATQYPANDDFSQIAPVNITVGSNACTIDIYNIRVYNNDLTRYQILDNWIADTQDIAEKMARYNRNNVYDAYGSIVIENLPSELPYLILQASRLPEYKGNKLNVSGSFTDKMNETNSFEFTGAQADVQGTSSAGYARKNYKIKFGNGFTSVSGGLSTTYKLRPNSIPTNTFTFKADVASSEGANNVELVRLYNDICPYKTPPQRENEYVRQGIDGFPIVIFHNNGVSTTFLGKYNFNNDKGTPEVYGFKEGDESWEVLNNTSERVLFKSADFSGTDWQNDFEARYPEDNVDVANLAAFVEWVASTDQTAATNRALPSPVSYGGKQYNSDTAEYRLAKFKNELASHAELDSAVFYYLFTELFLMVDSRAKNAFPSKFGSGKICWLPYDFDTAIGINNEGALTFGYELEDTDKVGSADVFNGQQSVFWINLRQAFDAEIRSMYQTLRSEGKLSYDVVETAFEEHQAVWAEAIWNEDAYYKYLQPLIEDGSGIYLSMLQGSKSEQRKWWLYNRFRYIDSKYNAGDALSDFITLRGYAVGNITIEPYADIYASVKFGSYLQQTRALRGSKYTITCPLANVNDTEIYIYSASQLKDVGDLSNLKVGLADFSMATKLQALKLGDASSSYSNTNLLSLTLGNNVLLKTLDVRNCPNLGTGEQQTIDISGCTNLEEVYLDGTGIKGIDLPNGGILKTLHLPATITNLTLLNQTALTEFFVPNLSNLTTLRLENVSAAVNSLDIVKQLNAGCRVRLIGIDWNFNTVDDFNRAFAILDTMRGLDEAGGNTDKAQVTGSVNLEAVTYSEFEAVKAKYPDIKFTYTNLYFEVEYRDYDNSLLYVARVVKGGNAIDPVAQGLMQAPTRADTSDTKYSYAGWGTLPTNVQANTTLIAQYNKIYAVFFYDGTQLVYTDWVASGGNATFVGTQPTREPTAQYTFTFSGWSTTNGGSANTSILNNITAPKTVYAAFSQTTRQYTVRFFVGDKMIEEKLVNYGSTATCSTTPTSDDPEEVFVGWNPPNTNIQGDTDCYAVFTNPYNLQRRTWAEISQISSEGNAANYFAVGDCKEVVINGTVGTLNLEAKALYVYILGFDHNSEHEGKGIHFGTFKDALINGKDLCLIDSKYNSTSTDGTKYFNMNHSGNNNYGGWGASDMRYDILGSTDVAPDNYGASKSSSSRGHNPTANCATDPVDGTLMAALPADLRAVMKPMTKYSDNVGGGYNRATDVNATTDYLPLLSEFEIFGARSYANSTEQTYQKQYDYYAAGNSKVKYRHSSPTSSAFWWERSAYYYNSNGFCRVTSNGYASYDDAKYSYGVAPAFKV